MKLEYEYKFKDKLIPKGMVCIKGNIIAVSVHSITSDAYIFPKLSLIVVFSKAQPLYSLKIDDSIFSMIYSVNSIVATCLNTIRAFQVELEPYKIVEKAHVLTQKSIPFLIESLDDYMLVGDLYCSISLYVLPNLELLASNNMSIKCSAIQIVSPTYFLVADVNGVLYSFYRESTKLVCNGKYEMAGTINVMQTGSLNSSRSKNIGSYLFGSSLGEVGAILPLSESDFNKLRSVECKALKLLEKESVESDRFVDGDIVVKSQHLKISLTAEESKAVESIIKKC
jgi:hypothetical protein